jgi:hypothetical protein
VVTARNQFPIWVADNSDKSLVAFESKDGIDFVIQTPEVSYQRVLIHGAQADRFKAWVGRLPLSDVPETEWQDSFTD